MKVFNHHVYEYRKGLRSLILYTSTADNQDTIKTRLERLKIDFLIYKLKTNNINVFFGDHDCIDVIKKIDKGSLKRYTPEEDFILGVMLGYCRKQQCRRYLKLKEKQ
ncbi:MAG TPA: DUF2023 family protein [Victivallales bacterium]|nr:DUF2023 family protein [Victivallales bacterium]